MGKGVRTLKTIYMISQQGLEVTIPLLLLTSPIDEHFSALLRPLNFAIFMQESLRKNTFKV